MQGRGEGRDDPSRHDNSIVLFPRCFQCSSFPQLYDSKTLRCSKVFNTDRELNTAVISPVYPHIICGGGQEASQVTTSISKTGKFEALFYHLVYAEPLGSVRGHFGPLRTVDITPDGLRCVRHLSLSLPERSSYLLFLLCLCIFASVLPLGQRTVMLVFIIWTAQRKKVWRNWKQK